MEDSQLFGKTDPTLLKWLNNIISSNLKTRFKMQTSTTCISISGKQWDGLSWSSDLFWTQSPSRPFSSCYLVFSSLKRGPEEDPFYQVTGKIKYLKGTFIVKNGTNTRKKVPWLHLLPRISWTRQQSQFGFFSSAGNVCDISTPDKSSEWEWPGPQAVASSGLLIWITNKITHGFIKKPPKTHGIHKCHSQEIKCYDVGMNHIE